MEDMINAVVLKLKDLDKESYIRNPGYCVFLEHVFSPKLMLMQYPTNRSEDST
jgi:hypothetical protein